MTTASPRYRTPTVRALIRAVLLLTLALGAGAVALAAAFGGAPAMLGAAIGVVMVCAFFATGALVLNVVASVAPATSLLVAMLTYVLQVLLIGLVFLGLNRSGALEAAVSPGWLGGTVIGCTLVWMVAQIVYSVRARVPVYDEPPAGREADTR